MADKVMVDYRRMDQRRYIYQPYWITSAEVVGLTLGSDETKVAILFSFPKAQYGSSLILIEKVCFQVTEIFAGGTITTALGSYTLATDLITTAGAATIVDADEYIEETDITHGTVGTYFALTGDWITAKKLATELTPVFITPSDTDVPAVGFYLTTDGTLTTGKGRAHMLITEVPLV
jgi:hypothetical protein